MVNCTIGSDSSGNIIVTGHTYSDADKNTDIVPTCNYVNTQINNYDTGYIMYGTISGYGVGDSYTSYTNLMLNPGVYIITFILTTHTDTYSSTLDIDKDFFIDVAIGTSKTNLYATATSLMIKADSAYKTNNNLTYVISLSSTTTIYGYAKAFVNYVTDDESILIDSSTSKFQAVRINANPSI